MESLSFDEAMRRLIDTARWNFAGLRGANREPAEKVLTEFDLPFVVEGAYDACIALLDYDVPRSHIKLYCGDNADAAQLIFALYEERLRGFATGAGTSTEEVQHHKGDTRCWLMASYSARGGGSIGVTHFSYRPSASEPIKEHRVWVEVAGNDVECIHGLPEESPWHIMFAGTSLQAKRRDIPAAGVRKKRQQRRSRRDRPSPD